MELRRKHIILGAVAALAAAGGGAAFAASQSGSPSEESTAIIDDAAAELGISPSRLSQALRHALIERVDEAVAAGRLSKEEGDALKERIQSQDFPLFGTPHFGFGHLGHLAGLDAAADYLGVTEAELRAELRSGKSLADVARDHGKSVGGLVTTLVAAAKEKLDEAVAAGRITQARANEVLAGLEERITDLVNMTGLGGRHLGGPHLGFRHFRAPSA